MTVGADGRKVHPPLPWTLDHASVDLPGLWQCRHVSAQHRLQYMSAPMYDKSLAAIAWPAFSKVRHLQFKVLEYGYWLEGHKLAYGQYGTIA